MDSNTRWACPKCGGNEQLKVQIEVFAHLTQSEDNFETEVDDSNHEWNGNSRMECGECDHGGLAGEFEVDPGLPEVQPTPCGHTHHFGYGRFHCDLPTGHEGRHSQGGGSSWTGMFAHVPERL